MLACMVAYKDIDFDGVLPPYHVPTLDGDRNHAAGCSSYGSCFALSYLRDLYDAVDGNLNGRWALPAEGGAGGSVARSPVCVTGCCL